MPRSELSYGKLAVLSCPMVSWPWQVGHNELVMVSCPILVWNASLFSKTKNQALSNWSPTRHSPEILLYISLFPIEIAISLLAGNDGIETTLLWFWYNNFSSFGVHYMVQSYATEELQEQFETDLSFTRTAEKFRFGLRTCRKMIHDSTSPKFRTTFTALLGSYFFLLTVFSCPFHWVCLLHTIFGWLKERLEGSIKDILIIKQDI